MVLMFLICLLVSPGGVQKCWGMDSPGKPNGLATSGELAEPPAPLQFGGLHVLLGE